MGLIVFCNNLKNWLIEISNKFNEVLLNSSNTLNLMQIIGLAVIAIIIPMAIAVFQKKESFDKLDKYVFLDFIVKSRWFLVYIGMVYIPLFFWDILPSVFRLLETLIWIAGICLIVKTVADSYSWVKGNTSVPRLRYLRRLKNKEEMAVVWGSLWAIKKLDFREEHDFFKIFAIKIDNLLKNAIKNKETLSKMLLDFLGNISNRTTSLISNCSLKIFNWNAYLWDKENIVPKNKERKGITYFEVSNPIDRITDLFIERNLTEGMDYALFDVLKKFINEDKKKPQYLDRFFNVFYRVFFENFGILIKESPSWDNYFPKEWKITKENILDANNFLTSKTLNRFLKWAQYRIISPKKDYDQELDKATSKLFPEVDPTIFSKILIFVLSLHDPNNWGKSVISKKWNFGGMRFVDVFSGDKEGKIDYKKERKNTFELTLIIFKEIFTEKKIKEIIKELKALNNFQNTGIEHRRDVLLNIFEEILKYIKETKRKKG